MVVRLLPKQDTRVRFSSSAQIHNATLAQLVEQHFRKMKVRGSTPRGGSNIVDKILYIGRVGVVDSRLVAKDASS